MMSGWDELGGVEFRLHIRQVVVIPSLFVTHLFIQQTLSKHFLCAGLCGGYKECIHWDYRVKELQAGGYCPQAADGPGTPDVLSWMMLL